MNKEFNKKALLLLPSLLLILTFVSCTKTDKTTILSPNVSEDVKSEENEAKLILEKGHNYLKDNDFENAKLTYEKATTIDKLNKDIYLEIKDKYIALNRFDDAYYFIQLAVTNNSDTENMKAILDTLKTNFATSPITANVFEGDPYTLQTSSTVKINGEDKVIPITWNEATVNTGASGTFTYTGTNKEFNREFTTILTVSPNVLGEEYCYIKNIYKSNGKTYIDTDLVEFYRGDKALEEAIKDNSNWVATDDTGRKFLYDSYYLKNSSFTIKTYEVNNNPILKLLSNRINIETTNGLDTTIVDYNKFESFIKSYEVTGDDPNPRWILFVIKSKNSVVYDISPQYTP